MDKDEAIRLEVTSQLNLDRRITSPHLIQVAVANGMVTLSGHVEHYMEQLAAAEAAEKAAGVKGVVQEIEVRLPETSRREDEVITRSACTALELNSRIPGSAVKVVVCDGWATLQGEVCEEHQKQEAQVTVSRLLGVKGVTNDIVVKPQVKSCDVTMQIEREFQVLAAHHAREIQVDIKEGGRVVLSGTVRAWIEIAEAEEAAHHVKGVTVVENNLQLTPLLDGRERPPMPRGSRAV